MYDYTDDSIDSQIHHGRRKTPDPKGCILRIPLCGLLEGTARRTGNEQWLSRGRGRTAYTWGLRELSEELVVSCVLMRVLRWLDVFRII